MLNKAYAGVLPLQGSDVAASWDHLWDFVLWLSIFFFVLVVGAMIYFAIKYRSRPGLRSKYITGSHVLEIIWTLIPTVLLLVIFSWGYVVYNQMTRAPSDAMEIRVIAKKWLWQFQYDDGRVTVNEVFVPMNKPVRLLMTSEDVLHSFFAPNFRVKQDVVPGMYTSVWFEPTVPGRHQIYCTEFCGTSHSEMLAQIVALEPEKWEAWRKGKDIGVIGRAGGDLDSDTAAPTGGAPQADSGDAAANGLVAQGQQLATSKGCIACHSVDGSRKIGPTWKGIFGSKEELADGSSVTVDENYIIESIESPQAKITKGYEGIVMPPFKGMISPTEMNAIIAYIKSLK